MRTIYFLFLLFLCSCSSPKEPEFIGLRNIVPLKVGLQEVIISADALYNNPNAVGLTIEQMDVNVRVNGSPLTEIEQNISADIIPKGAFKIPLKITFRPRDVLRNKSGIINSVMNTLISKEIELIYEGTLNAKVAGVGFSLPVDYRERILLKR